jgi:CheY-like chemotaxis protein
MGGTLVFKSQVGVGSTFTVRVVRDMKAPVGDPATPAGRAAPGDPALPVRTVLYVENDLSDLRVIERVLRHRPERLHVAVQGQMCLNLARQLTPSLILLELHLPDIRGEEVLHRLKLDPLTAGIPVAVFGADVAPGRSSQLTEAGAVEFLPKPLDIRRLIALLDRLAVGSLDG